MDNINISVLREPWGITRNTKLRLVTESDANFILSLRLDGKKNKFVSSVDNDLKKQIDWIRAYKIREKQAVEYYYIIVDCENDRLGTVRLYDIRGDSFCWGSWLIVQGAQMSASIESALNIYHFGFDMCGFFQSHFDVRKNNKSVVAFHKRFGAEIVNESSEDYYFILDKEKYYAALGKYKKYLIK